MKINIPVGSIIIVKEKFNWQKALKDREFMFNQLIAKIYKTECTSTALTDIDDEGNLHIIEVTKNGIEKVKYEDWQNKDKDIEMYLPKVEYSKETLYMFLDRISETKYKRSEKYSLYYKYLLYTAAQFINRRYLRNLSYKPPVLYTGQLPGYVWDTVTKKYNFWKEHTPKSLKVLVSLNDLLLFKGNSIDLK